MKISKLSNDFTPLQSGLLFGIDNESDTPSDMIVEIVDTQSGEVVATQLLRNATYAEVNIAPYVVGLNERKPTTASFTTISELPVRRFMVRCEDVESEEIAISVNRCNINPVTTLTTMSSSRRISYGEHDEVVVIASPQDTVTAIVTADDGMSIEAELTTSEGAVVVNIGTYDFVGDVTELEVSILCNGEEVTQLHYDFVPRGGDAVRVAWLSSVGSIERYTFPVSHKSRRSVERIGLHSTEGPCVVGGESRSYISLRSYYEPKALIEVLTEIVASPKVWIERGGTISGVEVTSDTLEYNIFNEPSAVALTLCTTREEVAL